MARKDRQRRVPDARSPAARAVPKAVRPNDRPIRFSFAHLELAHPKFSPDRCGEGYWPTLLDRLRAVGRMSVGEFMLGGSKALRSHSIDFAGTSEPGGFRLPAEVVGTPWQFSLTANQHGRVIGHVYEDVFFVVWLDPDHQLYP